MLKAVMRDPETIETELMEISAIPNDLVKFERIVVWCATHPGEVPLAPAPVDEAKGEWPEASRSPGTWTGSVLTSLMLYRERSGEENVEGRGTAERRSVFDTAT